MRHRAIPRNAHAHFEEKHIFILVRCSYMREGLMALCEHYAGWRICGVPGNIKELKMMLLKHPVDLVITDIEQGEGDIHSLMSLPDYVEGRRLLLTGNTTYTLGEAYRATGFDAVVSKKIKLHRLDSLIRELVTSGTEERSEAFTRQLYRLKEKKVLLGLLQGEKLKDIAQRINVSHSTACRLKKNILERVGTSSMNEMIRTHLNHAEAL